MLILAAAFVAAGVPVPLPHPGAGLRAVDDATIGAGVNQFLYTGRWRHVQGAADGRYAGTSSRSDEVGARMEFRFVGAKAQLYAVRGPAGGVGLISVDGGGTVRVSFYAPRIRPRALVYAADGLARHRVHVLVVVVSGQRPRQSFGHFVNIDEVAVEPWEQVAGIPRIQPHVAAAAVAPWPLGDVIAAVVATLTCIGAALLAFLWKRKTSQRMRVGP